MRLWRIPHEKEEKTLIKSQDTQNVIGYISRFHIGNQLDLYLNDEQGEWLRTYHFAYDTSKFEKTTQKEIDEDYAGTVIQEETDIIFRGRDEVLCMGFQGTLGICGAAHPERSRGTI